MEPGSSQRCTVAGPEAMGQAAYKETLRKQKEKMLSLRVMQQQKRCHGLAIPRDHPNFMA